MGHVAGCGHLMHLLRKCVALIILWEVEEEDSWVVNLLKQWYEGEGRGHLAKSGEAPGLGSPRVSLGALSLLAAICLLQQMP